MSLVGPPTPPQRARRATHATPEGLGVVLGSLDSPSALHPAQLPTASFDLDQAAAAAVLRSGNPFNDATCVLGQRIAAVWSTSKAPPIPPTPQRCRWSFARARSVSNSSTQAGAMSPSTMSFATTAGFLDNPSLLSAGSFTPMHSLPRAASSEAIDNMSLSLSQRSRTSSTTVPPASSAEELAAAERRLWSSATGMAPAGRFGHVAVALRGQDTVVVHGGRNTEYLDELWLYRPSSGVWRRIARRARMASPAINVTPDEHYHADPAGNWATGLAAYPSNAPWPSARSGHTATQLKDDIVYVFGGALSNTETTSELWALNPTSWRWHQLDTDHDACAGTPRPERPSGRKGHTTVELDGHLYLFGGAAADNSADPRVWRWTPPRRAHSTEQNTRRGAVTASSSSSWTVVAEGGLGAPPPRRYHVAAATPDGNMVIFGGQRVIDPEQQQHSTTVDIAAGGPCLNDTAMFDPRTGVWRAVEAYGDMPSPRMSCTGITRYHLLVVFDGTSAAAVLPAGEGYELDLSTGRWRHLPLDLIPRETGSNRGVTVLSGNTIVQYGGHTGTAFSREVAHVRLRVPRLTELCGRWLEVCAPWLLQQVVVEDRSSSSSNKC